MLTSLSAFFPCYNEETNIPDLVEQACAFLPSIAHEFEIIIVNDGSNDHTVSVVKSLMKDCPQLRLVTHPKNLGYGAALKTGIQEAKYDWTFWMDGDLQFHIKTLQSFLPYAKSYDAVIGYRAHRADTFLRKVNGELYTRLINFLFSMQIRDIDCGFKLIRTELLHALHLESSSAFTSAEVLIKLQMKKVKIYQTSVPHFPRQKGSPTGGNVRVIFKGLWQAMQFYLHHS